MKTRIYEKKLTIRTQTNTHRNKCKDKNFEKQTEERGRAEENIRSMRRTRMI